MILKNRTHLVLSKIQGFDTQNKIEQIDNDLFDKYKPKTFHGRNGLEVKFIDDFEESFVLINQHINKEAKTMTVFEYFKTIQVLKKQAKERQKALKKR